RLLSFKPSTQDSIISNLHAITTPCLRLPITAGHQQETATSHAVADTVHHQQTLSPPTHNPSPAFAPFIFNPILSLACCPSPSSLSPAHCRHSRSTPRRRARPPSLLVCRHRSSSCHLQRSR
ncbi:hypothetical protein Dimus_011141, partial [Dionaea muscipula]